MVTDTEILSIKLNYAASLPLSVQAAYLLNKKIAGGKFIQKTLPTARQLSSNSHIPLAVVEQAYKILAEKEVLGYDKERGYFLLGKTAME